MRQEFTRNWGPEQNLYSPTLVIPYQAGDRPRQYLKIAPARLDLAATLTPQERKRGLFHATVYDAKVDMNGAFVVPPEARLRDFVADKDGRFLWNEASIAFGAAANLTGLRATDNIVVDGTEQQWMPVPRSACGRRRPAAARRWCSRTRRSRRTRHGSHARAVQVGRQPARHRLVHACNSPARSWPRSSARRWPSPSFSGNTLPLSSNISSDGFEANWQTTEFGSPRIAPSAGDHRSGDVERRDHRGRPDRGDADLPHDHARGEIRALFVRAVVRDLFLLRGAVAAAIHVVQYGLLGLSLSLFSLLLLSLAEPIGYTNGYLVSAGLVLAQSTLYTAAVARRFKPAFMFALMLSSLFGFLYVLLGLETYSLLIGALALFVVVSALMVLTQMVKWPVRSWLSAPQA